LAQQSSNHCIITCFISLVSFTTVDHSAVRRNILNLGTKRNDCKYVWTIVLKCVPKH